MCDAAILGFCCTFPGLAYVSLIQATLVGCTVCYEIPAKDCELGLTVFSLQGL